MPSVIFTPHLQRFLDAPPREVGGTTVGEVLATVFADNPRLKGYVLDDQGRLRRHVTVFVAGQPLRDRDGLSDAVARDDEVYVLQALSGGSGEPGGTAVARDGASDAAAVARVTASGRARTGPRRKGSRTGA